VREELIGIPIGAAIGHLNAIGTYSCLNKLNPNRGAEVNISLVSN
jgi:hypothetical protein